MKGPQKGQSPHGARLHEDGQVQGQDQHEKSTQRSAPHLVGARATVGAVCSEITEGEVRPRATIVAVSIEGVLACVCAAASPVGVLTDTSLFSLLLDALHVARTVVVAVAGDISRLEPLTGRKGDGQDDQEEVQATHHDAAE